MICPHYKDVSVYDCKDCVEGLPSPEIQEELSTLRKKISELEKKNKTYTDGLAEGAEKISSIMDKHVLALNDEIESLKRQLVLAIAHDRQPYPTADAYEKACAALEKHRTRADKAEETLKEIRADVRSRFVSPQWDLKNVGTVSHCYICGGNGEEDCEPEHTPSCTLSIGVKEEP